MNQTQLKQLQTRIGATADGFWGPKSVAACQAHLRRMMPVRNPWPAQSQAALQAFYGTPGNVPMTRIDVRGLGISYLSDPVHTISCHTLVAESLQRILRALAASPHRHVLQHYAGVYYDRPMRGGSLPSLHARAAAIDLWPQANGNKTHWPTVAKMPIEVMEIFATEGWLAAGAFWSRDAMHFQATR
jgi:hypothetical protein